MNFNYSYPLPWYYNYSPYLRLHVVRGPQPDERVIICNKCRRPVSLLWGYHCAKCYAESKSRRGMCPKHMLNWKPPQRARRFLGCSGCLLCDLSVRMKLLRHFEPLLDMLQPEEEEVD